MLANLGCSQSHLGQQPVSICMCVPVSSSIWVNGLQYVSAPVTTGVGDVQRINRSNGNVIAPFWRPSRLTELSLWQYCFSVGIVGHAFIYVLRTGRLHIMTSSSVVMTLMSYRSAHFLHRCNVIEVTLGLSVCINTQNNPNDLHFQEKALPVQFPFQFGGINVAGDHISHTSCYWSPAEGLNGLVRFE